MPHCPQLYTAKPGFSCTHVRNSYRACFDEPASLHWNQQRYWNETLSTSHTNTSTSFLHWASLAMKCLWLPPEEGIQVRLWERSIWCVLSHSLSLPMAHSQMRPQTSILITYMAPADSYLFPTKHLWNNRSVLLMKKRHKKKATMKYITLNNLILIKNFHF